MTARLLRPGLAVVLAAVASLASLVSPSAAQAADDDPIRLAVLYFENQGNPELEMLKLGLAQMLITDLVPNDDLQVVERTRLNDILGELELQKTGVVDADSAVRIGKILGVDLLVQGYYLYFKPIDSLVIGAQVVSVETGSVLGAFKASGKQSDFLDLEKQLVAGLLPEVREAAGRPARVLPPKGGVDSGGGEGSGGDGSGDAGPAPSPTPGAVAGGTIPSGGSRRGEPVRGGSRRGTDDSGTSTAGTIGTTGGEGGAPVDALGAALAFSEGLDALDRKDVSRAREALRRAVELDPTLDDARDALAGIRL